MNNNAGQPVTLQIPIVDLVYKLEKNDMLQYSVDDIADWYDFSTNQQQAVTAGLGRQFLLNTYVVFNFAKDKQYIIVGQLKDLGKITDKERLWLMVFGACIVGLILIILIIKLAMSKKSCSKPK